MVEPREPKSPWYLGFRNGKKFVDPLVDVEVQGRNRVDVVAFFSLFFFCDFRFLEESNGVKRET